MRGIVQALAIIAPVVGIAIAGVALQDRMSTNSGAEPAAIAASAGLVHRNGPVLTLLVDSGAALALTDRAICGDLPCPERAATRYRYRGWDARAGGYRLMVGFSHPVEMILAWELAGDDPILFDGSHLLLHSGGALPQPPPPTRARLDTGLADWLANTAGARDQVEAPRLAKSGGRASRDGANLVLTLADKRKLVLTDVLACGQLICPPEIVIGFEYRGPDAKGRFHAIDEHFYETSSALLFEFDLGRGHHGRRPDLLLARRRPRGGGDGRCRAARPARYRGLVARRRGADAGLFLHRRRREHLPGGRLGRRRPCPAQPRAVARRATHAADAGARSRRLAPRRRQLTKTEAEIETSSSPAKRRRTDIFPAVMPGLGPGIHAFFTRREETKDT